MFDYCRDARFERPITRSGRNKLFLFFNFVVLRTRHAVSLRCGAKVVICFEMCKWCGDFFMGACGFAFLVILGCAGGGRGLGYSMFIVYLSYIYSIFILYL